MLAGPAWGRYYIGPIQLIVCLAAVIGAILLGGTSMKVLCILFHHYNIYCAIWFSQSIIIIKLIHQFFGCIWTHAGHISGFKPWRDHEVVRVCDHLRVLRVATGSDTIISFVAVHHLFLPCSLLCLRRLRHRRLHSCRFRSTLSLSLPIYLYISTATA